MIANLSLLTAVLAFSSIEVTISPIRHQIDPLALTFWRFALASICLLPFAFRKKELDRFPRDFKSIFPIILLGILNVVLSMGLHAVSVANCRPSTAAVLIASNPMFTNIFALLILREKLSKGRIVSIILGLSGVYLVTFKSFQGIDTLTGILSGLAAAIGFSLYTVLTKESVQKFGSLNNAMIGFLAGCAIDIPILHFAGIKIMPMPELWPRLIFLGVVVSGIGYLAFFKALSLLSAGKTSLLFFLKPPVSIGLAWLILGDNPNFFQLSGAFLIMTGIIAEKRLSPSPSISVNSGADCHLERM
ncbi:MAG: EamA family transporter [Candidatus Riflebacteria bacterium]|nr:EamA family transporter [Candidatus Riflebacteria bacterium]